MVDRPAATPLSISVTFPCYNEERNVEATTAAALRAMRRLGLDFEVIIVNDGSRDRTGAIADDLAKRYAEVRVIHNANNRGYGGALQRGLLAATKPWVFYTDGDGQFDFGEIEKLLPLLKEYDIVSGYRLNRRDPLIRKVNALCWTTLVNLVFSMRIRDIDCAFKIYPRRLFDEIELKSSSALIDAEIFARAQRLGYRIGQIGVHHYPRTAGRPTGARPRVVLQAFKELLALHREIRHTAKR